MDIKWLTTLHGNQIALSSSLYNKLAGPQIIILNIGLLKLRLDAVVSQELQDDAIGLPLNISQTYTIPTGLPYQWFLEGGQVHIGPVIGYVERGAFQDLQEQIYFSILPKFMEYSTIQGLIYICTGDSIRVEDNIVEGYYFDPSGHTPEEVWKYGKFPLPQAIFNRSTMSKAKIRAIRSRIGDKLFNSDWYNLNKWVMWQILSRNKGVKRHLPYTEKYQGMKQLKALLKEYKSLYLKPCTKFQGRGIMKITKARKGVLLTVNPGQEMYFSSYKSLGEFLTQRIKIPYILQQAVPFVVKNNQQIDFRLFIQKDHTQKWVYCGLMARIVPAGVIITNLRGNPENMVGAEALENLYNFDSQTVRKIKEEATRLVIKAALSYEQRGMHLGDVAADLVIDANQHIWLLELQLNQGIYGRTGPIPAEFYNLILTNPFKYAKALAGFK